MRPKEQAAQLNIKQQQQRQPWGATSSGAAVWAGIHLSVALSAEVCVRERKTQKVHQCVHVEERVYRHTSWLYISVWAACVWLRVSCVPAGSLCACQWQCCWLGALWRGLRGVLSWRSSSVEEQASVWCAQDRTGQDGTAWHMTSQVCFESSFCLFVCLFSQELVAQWHTGGGSGFLCWKLKGKWL